MECNHCTQEQRLRVLEADSKHNQATHKEYFTRFEQLGKDHTRIETQYAAIMAALAKLEVSVDELRNKPARRWESLADSALRWVVVSVLAAAALFR